MVDWKQRPFWLGLTH